MKDKNLKIAMFGHKRIPSREGGIEIVIEELATKMVKQGHSVTCYNRTGHHVSETEFDGKNLKEYKGAQLKSVLTINRKGLAAATSPVFGALQVTFGKYDAILFHAEGHYTPKLFRKRCVAMIHDA